MVNDDTFSQTSKTASIPPPNYIPTPFSQFSNYQINYSNQTIAHNEITINLDPFLVSDILIHELDVKMQEYDDRAEIVNEMSRALGQTRKINNYFR